MSTPVKKVFYITAGQHWYHHFTGPRLTMPYSIESIYGLFHPDKWHGYYARTEDVFANPERYLYGVDLWWASLNWCDPDRPNFVKTLRWARDNGTLIAGEPNCGWHLNLLETPPRPLEAWKEISFVCQPSMSPAIGKLYSQMLGKPYFGCVAPVDIAAHKSELDSVPVAANADKHWMFGHPPTRHNLACIQGCEMFGIPLIVNYRGGDPDVDRWKHEWERHREWKHVWWVHYLETHQQFLSQIKGCRGIFYMTNHPSTGRVTLYAALAGKPSITTASVWQEILFPSATVPPTVEVFADFDSWVAKAEAELPLTLARIEMFSFEKCQGRLEDFLTQHFPERAYPWAEWKCPPEGLQRLPYPKEQG